MNIFRNAALVLVASAITGTFSNSTTLSVATAANTTASLAPDIPATGSKIEDFVPAGWKIFDSAEGDLNGDKQADAALVLMKEGDDPQGGHHDKFTTTPRPLVVLHKQGDKYAKACVSNGAIMSGRQGNDFALRAVQVEIKNGNLITRNENAANSSTGYTSIYRLQSGEYKLIGFTKFASILAYEIFTTDDYNLNTGVCLEEDHDHKKITHSKSYFVWSGFATKLLQMNDAFSPEQWGNPSGTIIATNYKAADGKPLKAITHSVHTADDLYIAVELKSLSGADQYSLSLQTSDGKSNFKPSVESVASDKSTIYAKFPLKALAKEIDDGSSRFVPNYVPNITANIVLTATANGAKPRVIFSTGGGPKYQSAQIILSKTAALPRLQDWNWEHADFPL